MLGSSELETAGTIQFELLVLYLYYDYEVLNLIKGFACIFVRTDELSWLVMKLVCWWMFVELYC